MQHAKSSEGPTRRDLLTLIGMTAGSAAMYQAMTSLGFAVESGYKGPIKLEGDPKGASVLILGAGLAGMTAALELRQAGYKVQILEYNSRPGGRNWTLRGGDTYTELGGATQKCEFDEGLYINPGPWRIPYHHNGLLAYCKRLGVTLEPFQQLNHNAFLHSTKAFGGKPQRVRDIMTDFRGHTSELLAKVTQKNALEATVTKEDQEILLEALRSWGALDKDYGYKASLHMSEFRGFAKDPGGGLGAAPKPSEPLAFSDILSSRLWASLENFALYEFQTTMFQPVGGIDMIGKAFAREVGDLITYNAKVTKIAQDEKGVTVSYEDVEKPGTMQQAQRGLVRLHHTAEHSQPDRDQCRRAHAGGDRGRALRVLGEGRAAIQAPFLGGGRPDFRRRQLYRPADQSDFLPEHRFQQDRQGRAAWRPTHGTGRIPTNSRRWRRRSASSARSSTGRRSIRNTRTSSKTASPWPGTARPSRSAAPATGPRRPARSTTTISARSTGASFSPASTPPTSRPGWKGRSCRHWTRSQDCTNAS